MRYVEHDVADEGRKIDTRDPHVRPERELTCDRLVLSAGTLGSTYLLLKSRDAFPGLSPRLGTRFGGNGDLLTFALGADRPLEPSRGPGDHERAARPRRARRGQGPRALRRGRGLPRVRHLARPGHAGRRRALALPAGGGAARLRAASAQARGRPLRRGLLAPLGHPGRRRLAPAPGHGAGRPRREHGPHRRRQAPGRLGEGEVRAVLRRPGRLREGDRRGARRQVRAQPDLVPRPPDHRAPARRLPAREELRRRASSTRTARSSATRASRSPTARSCRGRWGRTRR